MWIDVKDKEYVCRNYADQDLVTENLILAYNEKVSVHASCHKIKILPLRDNLFNVMNRIIYNNAFCLFVAIIFCLA